MFYLGLLGGVSTGSLLSFYKLILIVRLQQLEQGSIRLLSQTVLLLEVAADGPRIILISHLDAHHLVFGYAHIHIEQLHCRLLAVGEI